MKEQIPFSLLSIPSFRQVPPKNILRQQMSYFLDFWYCCLYAT